MSQPTLIPLTRWPEHHDWPTVSGFRHIVFNANHNGAHTFIRRAGKRVLIDEQAFFQWIADQNPQDVKQASKV